MVRKILLFFLPALLASGMVSSQNTVSPYSIFGPGEIVPKGFGRSLGMGKAGIALPSDNRLNNLNPASYSGIGRQNFILEIGIDGKYSVFDSRSNRLSGFNANMRYLAFGLHIANWWASTVELSPFSTVGYSIRTQKYIEGSPSTYSSTFTGSGGITQVAWGNAFRITRHLSVGMNSAYLFGPLSQQESIVLSTVGNSYIVTQDDYLHSLRFDWGAQYTFQTKNLFWSLGATYANRQSLRSTYSTTVQDGNYSTINSREGTNKAMKVPQTFGAGLAVTLPGRLSLAADYQLQKWSDLRYPTMAGKFSDATTYAAGLELKPWKESLSNKFFQNWSYRAGASYSLSYLTLGSNQISNLAFNLGFGLPFRNQSSTVNLAFEAGKTGTTRNNLVRENYLLMHLNISINELWFIKKKFY